MNRWRLITDDNVHGADGLAFDEALAAGYGRIGDDVLPILGL